MQKLKYIPMRVLWSLFLLSFCHKALSQYVFNMNDSLQKAMQCVYEFRYHDAKKIISQQRTLNDKNVACDFIENTMYVFYAHFNDDPQYFEQMKSIKSKYTNRINQLPDNNPWKRNLDAQIRLQAIFVHLKYEEYYTAFKELRSVNKLLNANKKIAATFLPDLLPEGLLNVIVSSIPDNIRWIAETFGLRGSYNAGITNIQTVLLKSPESSEFRWLEAQSLLSMALIQMSMGDNPTTNQQVKQQLEQRYEKIKNSPLLMRTLAALCVKTGDNNRAIEVLEYILQKKQSSEYPILYYQLGRCKLQRMDVDSEKPFLSYLSHYQYHHLIKASYQHIAWHYYLQNNMEKYHEYIKKVANCGTLKNDADKEAENEYKRGVPPNKNLLKARLLFDGGYFNEALSVLQNSNQQHFSNAEKLEYVYRLGRIYHGQNNYSQAITYYKKTLEQGVNSTVYYVANAALMLGNIYEQQKNYTQAMTYYKKCQSLSSDSYENSIHQKAKVGENRCKQYTKN